MTSSKGHDTTAVHKTHEMLGRLLSQTKHDVHGGGISKGYDTCDVHNFREMLGPRYKLGSMTYWYLA